VINEKLIKEELQKATDEQLYDVAIPYFSRFKRSNPDLVEVEKIIIDELIARKLLIIEITQIGGEICITATRWLSGNQVKNLFRVCRFCKGPIRCIFDRSGSNITVREMQKQQA
jgi:hypothetical protein